MNPIFSMLQNPSKSIEREMSAVRLSPEEVFLEAMDQVDYALEDPVTANIDFMGRVFKTDVKNLHIFCL